MEQRKILVIEDNADTRRFLGVMLSKEYQVFNAENGVIGIEIARREIPDLIILDIMLPVLSGYDTCSLLKQDEKTKHIPIIFLSAKNTTNDITQGLSTGGDDYIPKPFDYKELKARIEARLRSQTATVETPLQVGDLLIKPNNREVSYAGQRTKLTLTEFDILRFLASRAGEVVSRDEIIEQVWRETGKRASDRTIDVHVRALRKKLPPLTRHVVSVYGTGYRYEK
jgi:DNA-binding response OmpR family regulator